MHQFDIMPPNAKTWVYASNRKLTFDEQNKIIAAANIFTSNWKSHGQTLKATFDILHDMFLVLMVDENINPVGGCATDDSIHFIQEMEVGFDVKLFNRLQVELFHDNEIIITSKNDAARLYLENKILGNSVFFNKVVTNKQDFDNNFKTPFNKSWVYQAIKQTAIV